MVVNVTPNAHRMPWIKCTLRKIHIGHSWTEAAIYRIGVPHMLLGAHITERIAERVPAQPQLVVDRRFRSEGLLVRVGRLVPAELRARLIEPRAGAQCECCVRLGQSFDFMRIVHANAFARSNAEVLAEKLSDLRQFVRLVRVAGQKGAMFFNVISAGSQRRACNRRETNGNGKK